jgi:signal transduction histidine kinase/DNA-binding response OmpR family regulator
MRLPGVLSNLLHPSIFTFALKASLEVHPFVKLEGEVSSPTALPVFPPMASLDISTLEAPANAKLRRSRVFRTTASVSNGTHHAPSEPADSPEERPATPDRYSNAASTRWADLIDSTATLPSAMTLEHVQQFFRENEHETFAAVLEGTRIVGLASELSLSRKLTASRGLGYCVYAKTALSRHVEPECLIIREDDPVRDVLRRVMTRTQGFFDDIIVTDAGGKFLGLIRTRTMMLLQHRISLDQVGELESLATQLNQNNVELERARDAATQATEMKSSFLANMSHEIRTPLNGILGMVKILLRTPLADSQRRYASTVLQSANALLSILNDILDFSKIEAGKMSFESVPFDLSDLAEESVQMLAERAREKGLEIFSWTDPEATTQVLGDPTRLRQVILNLASNAVKFTDKGQVVIRIHQLRKSPTHTTLKITVEDTGIGIAPEIQSRLFTAFEQGDRSTSRKFGGTGLGLAISKKIIDLCGGTIGCESQPGQGSTFWFTLDLPRQTTGLTPRSREDELWGLRILIAHDNPAFGEYLENNLSRWKVVTRVVRSSSEALATVQAQSTRGTAFDVVIADHQMAGFDGLELARRLHQDPANRRTKTILLTTFDDEIPGERCAEAGVAATLTKPLKPSELYHTIARSLAREGAPEEKIPPVLRSLSLPAGAAASPTPPVEAPPPALTTTAQERACPPLKLLLVEDSPVNREVALILLGSWGHQLDTAEHGLHALEKLRQHTYDAVLMDCQMPEMDGYAATRAIRDPQSSVLDHHIPIIAMTANAMPGDRERCLEAGMNDYVGKPIDEAELLAALLRCAHRNSTATTVESHAASSPKNAIPASEPASASDDEPYFPARLIQLFLKETENRLGDLTAAFERRDGDALQRIAHTIKGTAGNFRAQRLYELARDIESMARAGQIEPLQSPVAEIRSTFAAVREKYTTHEHAS